MQIKVITLHFLRLDKPNHTIKTGNVIRTLVRTCSYMAAYNWILSLYFPSEPVCVLGH